MAFDDWTQSSTSELYRKIDYGKFILDTSTPDEPVVLTMRSNVRQNGDSDYVVKEEVFKNSTLPGKVEDEKLQVYTVIRCPLKYFTEAEILASITSVHSFLTQAGHLGRLLKGER